jgi:tagatose 6-phosphate kinase
VIVCVCLSPAVDVTYHVDRLTPGETVRVRAASSRPGGKAVNVARILHSLGEATELVAPVGGATGAEFAADLARLGVPTHLVPCGTPTRRTVTIVADDGPATVLSEPADIDCWPALLDVAAARIARAEVVVVSGSVPLGTPADAVGALVGIAREAERMSIVDTSGPALRDALAAGPTVVKPNAEELAALDAGGGDPVRAVRALAAAADTTVVASFGAEGVVAADRQRACTARSATALSGNPTGAGDALVAGLARALHKNRHVALADLVREPVAMAAAAVLSAHAGELDPEVVAAQRAQVVVRELGGVS